jgi:phosphoribosyl 1,2-cyclic phosphodiesterase
MKFTVLGSGSTGNCVLISTEKTNVLVDAGLSAKEITRRLHEVGVSCQDIDAVLVTHEHGDHIGGMRVLLQSVDCPVYISEFTEVAYYVTRAGGTYGDSESSKRKRVLKDRAVPISSHADFRIGDIDFTPFSVPHDAVDNFGFVACHDGVRIATLMDFGHISDCIKAALNGCDAIVIESNHSRDMLRTCHVYTSDLKQRIMGDLGHLSNESLADWLQTEFDGAARHIVLAHLSQRANEPHLARIMAETALKMRPPLFRAETTIHLSSHRHPTEWFTF